ncbi:MAG: IclR family transcriptional regulator [Lentisphaeria bacterium]|nr:IclR family transcriptional regulator [Lentisphaeria bacterium]
MMERQDKKPLIQVLERAFDIMEMLAKSEKPARATDIASALGLGLQTTNNLLRTMYQRGYLSQDETRSYRLGPQCFYLGSFADRWSGLRAKIREPLRELARVTGLCGFVGVIENDKLLCVGISGRDGNGAEQPPQLWAEELHSTACGRVLLAAMPEPERRKLYARTTRRKITGRTVIDPVELERLLAGVAAQGYAEVRGESRPGVSSAAIPVPGNEGGACCALALSGSDPQWEELPLPEKLALLRRAAKTIRG